MADSNETDRGIPNHGQAEASAERGAGGSGAGLRGALSRLTPAQVREVLAGMDAEQLQGVAFDWEGVWARPEQLPPDDGDWSTFLYLAGRGAGKTRSAAEWVRKTARRFPGCRIAIVARTAADVRDVCIEGESGLLAVHPPAERPLYEPSKRRITWRNGSQATAYSADEPDLLRGPQHHFAWCDELAAWDRLEDAWSNLRLGLRLGTHPRAMVTTTPRPLPLIRDLLKSPTTVVRRGSTFDNAANLAPSALAEFRAKYEGTRLGRQELFGEVLDDVPGALWNRAMLDGGRVETVPDLVRVVVAVDPAVTSGEDADETGIVIAGKGTDGHLYVLADRSCRLSPDGWARRAVAAFDEFRADRIVAETNQGGEMVESVIRTVRPDLPVIRVHASRGKRTRAEPVAALYEQGRVHHRGAFAELEDQMCTFAPEAGAASPDRVDALVWGLSELSGRGGAVLQFDRSRNDVAAVPTPAEPQRTVIGVRLGVTGDALAVLSWTEHSPVVRLLQEWSGPKQAITDLAERLRLAIEKHEPDATVIDAGELGSAVVDELRRRFSLPLEAAVPRDRLASIELLNDALRGGRFLARSDGLFARDSRLLEWDRTGAGQGEIVGTSDVADAVIAAFLRALAWLHEPEEAAPPPRGTPEWHAYQMREMEQQAIEEFDERQRVLEAAGWDPWLP